MHTHLQIIQKKRLPKFYTGQKSITEQWKFKFATKCRALYMNFRSVCAVLNEAFADLYRSIYSYVLLTWDPQPYATSSIGRLKVPFHWAHRFMNNPSSRDFLHHLPLPILPPHFHCTAFKYAKVEYRMALKELQATEAIQGARHYKKKNAQHHKGDNEHAIWS